MASLAAVLHILVQANGVTQTATQLRSLDGDLKKADKTAGGFKDKLKGFAKGAGAVGGFAAVTGAVGAAIGEFTEARKVAAQTNAVIKSTGGVANVTAKDVDRLTGSISKKVGIDDEAIAKGANLLLTFKNVRNEAGKGANIFDQATAAAVDLSAAGFGSLESTSKQLGKALNDPVKGLTALGRSGVTFSEDQKKAIEALMETGKASDRVKAQQIILKEVQSQVGGSAQEQATAGDHLKVALGNLAEAAGSVLVPALDKVARVLTDVVTWTQKHKTEALVITGVITGIATAIGIYNVATKLAAASTAAWTAVTKVATGVQAAFNLVMRANPIALVVTAIAALVAGLIVAYKKSETFRDIVNGAFSAVKDVAKAVFGWLKEAAVNVVQFLKGRWELMKSVTSTAWRAIKAVIVDPIRAAFGWLREAARNVAGFLRDRWENIKGAASGAWEAVKSTIVDAVRGAFDVVRDAVRNVIEFLKDRAENLKNAAELFAKPFIAVFDNMRKGVERVVGWVKDLIGAVKDAVSWIGKIKLPKINLPDLNPFGGKGNGSTVGPARPGSVDAFNGLAKAFGNVVTSGYRPGDDGWHGQNRARDYAGGNMLGFARKMLDYAPILLELIYTPLGKGVKNGQIVPISFFGSDVMADHYDHVHVAMARGGKVRKGGWALVGEQGPELANLPSGSRVYPAHQTQQMLSSSDVKVILEDHRTRVIVDDVERIVEHKLRKESRSAARGLPGRGGGLTVG